jgi:protein TonB
MYRISTDPEIELGECYGMQRHGMLEFGISIGLHAVGLITILLITMVSSTPLPADTPFVMVHLVPSVSEDNGMAMDPFPGAGNGSSPRSVEAIPDVNPKTPHIEPITPKAQPVVNRKLRKIVNRKRIANISSDPSMPVRKMESEPVPSDRSDSSDDVSPKQSSNSTETADVGKETPFQEHDKHGTGSGIEATNRLGSVSGNGSGTDSGNGMGKGSGTGIALLDMGGGSAAAFHLKQVDQPPVPVEKVDPEFPQAARKLGVTGKVMVKFLVNADGNVHMASILEADPEGIFDTSALDAVHKWRFKPGVYRGKAVATWVILPVHFRLIR